MNDDIESQLEKKLAYANFLMESESDNDKEYELTIEKIKKLKELFQALGNFVKNEDEKYSQHISSETLLIIKKIAEITKKSLKNRPEPKIFFEI